MSPDEFLGPYKIGQLIGRGGMGVVYSAQHAKTGERVAVKLIATHLSDDPRFRRRFAQEIRALILLKHPGIVGIIGEGEDETGRLFYSMELISGETVQTRLRRTKKIDSAIVVDIAIQVCSALKHAHDIGVTHRDLKPANLILTDDHTVKLVDFGIPKVFGDDNEQTHVGSVLGTPDYMAPEQAGGGSITPRTDLYSLGSVMYAMLVGRAPFKGKSATEVIDALQKDRPIPLDLVDADLPEDLVELVHQLLEKDPDKRPPTALAVMVRLKQIRDELRLGATVGDEDSQTDGAGDSSGLSDTNSDAHRTAKIEKNLARSKPNRNATVVSRPSDSGTRAVSQNDARRVSPSSPTEVACAGKTRRPVDSDAGGRVHPVAPENDSRPRARFADVSQRQAGGQAMHADETMASMGSQVTAGVVIAIVLLLGGYLFYRASRPPTADQLYESISESADAPTMSVFLRRFPDDPRAEVVRAQHMESRIAATLRRLSAQANIGITPLTPAQEGFLSAMEHRTTAPHETAQRLEQWINAFEPAEDTGDKNLAALLELARYEKNFLTSHSPASLIDERASELLETVRNASEMQDDEAARKKLTGIIETFESTDWAKPAVDEARRLLDSL